MEYTTKCLGCGEEFYESELQDKLCADCQFLSCKHFPKKGKAMKIDFNQVFVQFGTKEPIFLNGKPYCLKDVAIKALTEVNDTQIGEEKIKRANMAEKLLNDPDPEFTVNEIATIKNVIGIGFGPIIVKQAWAMIEGKST